jgi:hypothetical protein
MPPKKKEKSSSENAVDKANMAAGSTGLEEFYDQRLKLQSEQMNVLFAKFTKSTKNDLEEVKKSQSFLRGCLYGSEPAQVPELARVPEMNFTTRLHETYMKGWLFLF